MSLQTENPEARLPDTGHGEALRLGFLTLQLALLLALFRGFRIQEDFGFLRLAPVVLIGFVANALAPAKLRPALFALISIAGVLVVLPFPASAVLIGLGLGLLGICHLPIPLAARVTLLLATGLALAAIRSGRLELSPPSAEWVDGGARLAAHQLPTLVLPVLAAMFMFRLILYLHELRHEDPPATLWERLSYFFMLPNVCFLLFPVVDYRRFRSTYYDAPATAIYQKGLSWMTRGLTQLLLYRLVYLYLVPAPGDIQDLWGFARFVLSSYLLYLHISGQFHLVVGILCIFGFNLPTTHHLYYLAPDFNSFWRRINIYWRDFMTKLVFYPAFAGLGGRPMVARLIGATSAVFVTTWLLHSYQSFWLRGEFPLEWRDVVFWGVLGGLVVVNSLREVRGPATRPSETTSPLRRALVRSVRTLSVFTVICVLWSLWSSSSIAEWLGYATRSRSSSPRDLLLLLVVLAGVVALGTLAYLASERRRADSGTSTDEPPWWDLAAARPALYTSTAGLALAVLLGAHTLGWLGGGADEVVASLRQNRLNVRDQELADRGYYEGVVDAGSFASALWKGHLRQPPGPEWAFIRDTEFVRFTGDLLEYRLEPGYRGSWRDAPLRLNEAGFRDSDPASPKPPGTRRIVLLGASYEMGAGVADGEIFPALLEEMLARRTSASRSTPWEVLNASIGGYGLVQRAELLRRELSSLEADLVVLTLYTTEENRLLNHLGYVAAEGLAVEAGLAEVLARAGVEPGTRRAAAREALRPHAEAAMAWALRRLAEEVRGRGVPLIAVTVPTAADLDLDPATVTAELARLRTLAEAAGIEVLDLGDVYGGRSSEAVRLAPWDRHANALGHRLLAEGFYELLDEEVLPELEAGATRPGPQAEEGST